MGIESKAIKPARRKHGDHIRAKDSAIVITQRGTDKPHVIIKPGYNPGIGPHLSFYRVMLDGSEDYCFTIGTGGVNTLLRWLPMTLTTARRMAHRPKGKQSG